MRIHHALRCGLLMFALAGSTAIAQAGSPAPQRATITVRLDQPGAKINPAMWGAFFEDINFGADGGLYAELVKNRGFEFPEPMMGWITLIPGNAKGDVTIQTESPYRPSQTHYLRVASKAEAQIAVINEGFRGMGVREGEAYDFSAQIRNVEGNARLVVRLLDSDGATLASTTLAGLSADWSKVQATFKPSATDPHARLSLLVSGSGTLDFDFVSLFPQKTWKNRPGGLRADMVQTLADMNPGFLRFPGGCIVEGGDLSKRYQWKTTIGPVEDRKLILNRWNCEFTWRPTADYYQSFGLGFFEFFQLCEDLGIDALPILNAGMACQFSTGELCPVDELQPYIQDALDLIEFANGPADSTWGKKRAEMGHPAPFNPPLTMLGVGNEQWGPQYMERLIPFTRAIKAKYPKIQIISAAGPTPDDERFVYLWPLLQKLDVDGHKADIVDQHCYANPVWFLANSDRFDDYDRNGPKIFFGEFAAQSVAICSPKNRNNLECALAEAACMTGLERNADVVTLSSYAPLYANIDAWQWTPDLMWTNSLETLPTANYYVQQLFCKNRGDVVLPTTNDAPVDDFVRRGGVSLGTKGCAAEFKEIRVTRNGNQQVLFESGDTIRQNDAEATAAASMGDLNWADYTLSLKVRRTSEAGAVVVTVCNDATPARASRIQWLLGAPVGNLTVADPSKPEYVLQTHFAEQDTLVAHTPGTLVANQWHDVKITVEGNKVECTLDGKQIHSATLHQYRVPSLFTSAVRDVAAGQTILKVVNPGDRPTDAAIKLAGATQVRPTGQAITLTGDLAAENTFDNPKTVVPVTTPLSNIGDGFHYTFPPRSFTVLRLGTP